MLGLSIIILIVSTTARARGHLEFTSTTLPGRSACDDGPVEVSNPDKPMFPAVGLTKTDLVAHYVEVAAVMLPWLARRPLTLQRFPNGVGAKGFMQKNASSHFPESILRYEVDRREGGTTTYPVVESADDLAYLANQGTITFHMWTSTIDDPDRPDWFVLDLDPSAGDLDGVRRVTTASAEILTRFGLDPVPVATGSKGFHLWCRLAPVRTWDEVALAARAAAGLVAAEHPDEATIAFLKAERAGRVFVDWLRNGPIATSVVPFSLRPRPTAPVAVPVTVDELPSADPAGWTLGAIDDRLAMAPDPSALDGATLAVDDIVTAARDAGVDLDTPFDRFGRR